MSYDINIYDKGNIVMQFYSQAPPWTLYAYLLPAELPRVREKQGPEVDP